MQTMPFISTKDTEFGDFSKTDKRLIRATLKPYEKTGTYVFLKLLKKGPKKTSLNREFCYLCKTLGTWLIRQRRYLNQKKSQQKTVQQNRPQ